MDLSVGQRIAHYRKKIKLSQKDLAAKLGISPPALNRYERGSRELSVSVLVEIAKILNVTGDALLGFEDPDFTALKTAKSNTLRAIHNLNYHGQERVLEFISALKDLPRYVSPSL